MAGNAADTAQSLNNNSNAVSPRKYLQPGPSGFTMYQSSAAAINNNNQPEGGYGKHLSTICKKVKAGQKIVIIMRGPPGSGKSTLAESLLHQCRLLDKYQKKDFVFSSDDYFNTRRGYAFNPNVLPEAHEWNQNRVRQKAAAGWSPIIVDNTNIMVWEMQPYVQMAVQHGYLIELLEPQTAWCKSASKLSQKNIHGVPRENIQRMLERYEKTTVQDLLKLLKETKYTVSLPQLRTLPALPAMPVSATPPLVGPTTTTPSPTPSSSFKLNANAQSWVPYEQQAPSYWGQAEEKPQNASQGEKSLLDLLRDEPSVEELESAVSEVKVELFQRHAIDCPKEAAGFVLLRQMYPNKQVGGLWDLYVKCKGDVDWAVDILLKEDELSPQDPTDFGRELDSVDRQFQCACNGPKVESATPTHASKSSNLSTAKPQRQQRPRRTTPAAHKEIQLQIENCFVLGDEQYSEHTRKIRDIRNGILDQPLSNPLEDAGGSSSTTNNEEDETDADAADEEDNTLLEMDLGSALVDQLRQAFEWEGSLGEILPEKLATKVFVPRTLAKQLYMLWIESIYNQMEEQRNQTLRDDEQFARLLKNPKYAECSESPSNVNELLDMELAWSIYNSEQQAAQEAASRQPPNDIATHLTKMKLCEKFPEVPKETVLEIFAATGSNYVQTVEVIDSNVKSNLSQDELFEKALKENEKLNAQVAQQEQQQQTTTSRGTPVKSPQLHEEAKRAALRDFEETRNLAAHHSQLKAECYHKAKQAVQQGNGSVALYYSEIAQLHKKKVDVFNHRAANAIMEVHKHTQNNPDLLDLHYLHTMEAISCLDLFLDRHIALLRSTTRVYKHLFVITGRGLHSANGVSTIKNRVKARLGERRLRWEEVNPGLLRVKIFSASRHAESF